MDPNAVSGEYTTDLRIENLEELDELAETVLTDSRVGKVGYEDWQADNNIRAGRAAVALGAYAQSFDMHEPLETVVGDLLGDLMHLCNALVAEDEGRVDFYAMVDRAHTDWASEINGVV